VLATSNDGTDDSWISRTHGLSTASVPLRIFEVFQLCRKKVKRKATTKNDCRHENGDDNCREGNAPVLNYGYLKGCQQRHRMAVGRAYGQQARAAISGARYTALRTRNSVLPSRLRENFWYYETREQLQNLKRRVGGTAASGKRDAIPAAWHLLPGFRFDKRPQKQERCRCYKLLRRPNYQKDKHASSSLIALGQEMKR